MATGVFWWVLGLTDEVTDQPGSAPTQGSVFHGTRAQAQHKASLLLNGTLTGPFDTEAQAEAVIKAGKVNKPDPKSLGSQIVGGALTWERALAKVLGALTQESTWLRVGEGAVGIVIIAVALKALFPSQVATATGVAKTAVKIGALA